MTGRICILTPDTANEEYYSRWRQVLDITAEPLRRAGFSVEPWSWNVPRDWSGFDLVLPLLVWGYPFAEQEWLRRLDAFEAERAPLANPASVLRWNSDKAYLGRLSERGAPVLPTIYHERLDLAGMNDAAERFGTDRLVAKPQVSAGAWQTIRWSPGEPLDGGPEGAAMVQPYLPEIERSGEVSLIYFGRRFSHAIRKVPQPGDFRVQPEYSGIITRHDPPEEERRAAERVLGAVDEPLLYARVDLVRGLDGAPALIELELIEPDLYLGFDPSEGRLFAEAAKELIAR